VLTNAAALLSGDASDAASILGDNDCAIPEDMLWARRAVEALDGGVEDVVRKAGAVLDSLAGLEALIPGSADGLAAEVDCETIREILDSDRFHEKAADLRSAVRRITDAAAARYEQAFASYEAALQAGLASLEAEPAWPRLDTDDQEEIAARLRPDMPAQPDTANPLRSLQTLLVRESSLARTLDGLRREIELRAPAEPEPQPEPEPGPDEGEIVLGPADLGLPPVLRSPDDLKSWLSVLESRLGDLLKKIS
jgi:hypothetical protein